MIDRRDLRYAGDLAGPAVVQRLADARSWECSANYLLRKKVALDAHGIPDAGLELLGILVETAQAGKELAVAACIGDDINDAVAASMPVPRG